MSLFLGHTSAIFLLLLLLAILRSGSYIMRTYPIKSRIHSIWQTSLECGRITQDSHSVVSQTSIGEVNGAIRMKVQIICKENGLATSLCGQRSCNPTLGPYDQETIVSIGNVEITCFLIKSQPQWSATALLMLVLLGSCRVHPISTFFLGPCKRDQV